MKKIYFRNLALGLFCLCINLSSTYAIQDKCAKILVQIATGIQAKDRDLLEEAVALSETAIEKGEIFWITDLTALELIVLRHLETQRESPDDTEHPLNHIREAINNARYGNLPAYLEKLKSEDSNERQAALKSLFIIALQPDVIGLHPNSRNAVLKGIEQALSHTDLEVQRSAFRGLWALWRQMYVRENLLEKRKKAQTESSEEDSEQNSSKLDDELHFWTERKQEIENLFAPSIEARLRVLKYDLDQNTFSEPLTKKGLALLHQRRNILPQLLAEAIYEAISEHHESEIVSRPATERDFETEFSSFNIAGVTVHLDLKNSSLEDTKANFSPELLRLLADIDPQTNENARLYATFLIKALSEKKDPRSKKIFSAFAAKLENKEKNRKDKNDIELINAALRNQQLRDKKREGLFLSVNDSSNREKENEAIRRIEEYLEIYGVSYADLKTPKGLSLDQVADAVKLSSFASRLREKFLSKPVAGESP